MKLILSIILSLFIITTIPGIYAESVPDWVKNTAGWWATDAISEKEFVNAIEFLANEGIIMVESTNSSKSSESVPDWVKNAAGWWATDAISEKEFVNAIEFLANEGIIQIKSDNNCEENISKFFNDKERIIQTCEKHESNISELIPYQIEIEINSEGFRGKEFLSEKPGDVYRIFMIGGSTMFGSSITDDTTIPSILQKMLDTQNLDLKIEVINAGMSGGNTISETELIKSKITKYEPDLLIIYDGWNDLSADYPVNNIIYRWAKTCALGYENNFDVIIALQPIAGFGNKKLTYQERINSLTGEDHNEFQLIQGRSTYDWLAREMQTLGFNADQQLGKEICKTYDLRTIFDDVNGTVYWDQGHILHTGNLILAEKFFEISMEKINSSFEPKSEFTKIISNYNSISILTYLFDKIGINDETFQTELTDITKIKENQGKYFQLKNEFENISDSFIGKDLRDIDLRKINLKGQDLTGANLSGQDLRHIDLRDTIIRSANLSDVNLQGKNMSGMDLRGINFMGANLKDVNFSNSVFSKPIQAGGINYDCDDEDKIINIVKLFKCFSVVIDNETIRTDFTNANLSNANFNGVEFFGVNFSNAKLNNISAKITYFLKSDFTNSEMKNFEGSEIWLQSNLFYNADVRDSTFDLIFFVDTDFTETNFQGTEFKSIFNIGSNNFSCKNNAICDE